MTIAEATGEFCMREQPVTGRHSLSICSTAASCGVSNKYPKNVLQAVLPFMGQPTWGIMVSANQLLCTQSQCVLQRTLATNVFTASCLTSILLMFILYLHSSLLVHHMLASVVPISGKTQQFALRHE